MIFLKFWENLTILDPKNFRLRRYFGPQFFSVWSRPRRLRIGRGYFDFLKFLEHLTILDPKNFRCGAILDPQFFWVWSRSPRLRIGQGCFEIFVILGKLLFFGKSVQF